VRAVELAVLHRVARALELGTIRRLHRSIGSTASRVPCAT
jgi:hypothetical protein